jgi:hypothetical protein
MQKIESIILGRRMKVYSVSRLLLTGLTSLLLLIVIVPGIVFASSNDWSEVARFTGKSTKNALSIVRYQPSQTQYYWEQYTTDYFTCDHVDWRIRWEYTPKDAYFIVDTYNRGYSIDTIIEGGKVEAILSSQLTVESFIDDPDERYLKITLDGNVTNFAGFPVYNVTLHLTFDVVYYFTKSTITVPLSETVDIGTMSSNSTRQISETFVSKPDYESKSVGSNLSYDIEWDQNDKPSGVSRIYGYAGTFYMVVDTDAESYTIIIEQDLNSIPEFSSWILLTLFLTATVFALVVRRRINHNSGL